VPCGYAFGSPLTAPPLLHHTPAVGLPRLARTVATLRLVYATPAPAHLPTCAVWLRARRYTTTHTIPPDDAHARTRCCRFGRLRAFTHAPPLRLRFTPGCITVLPSLPAFLCGSPLLPRFAPRAGAHLCPRRDCVACRGLRAACRLRLPLCRHAFTRCWFSVLTAATARTAQHIPLPACAPFVCLQHHTHIYLVPHCPCLPVFAVADWPHIYIAPTFAALLFGFGLRVAFVVWTGPFTTPRAFILPGFVHLSPVRLFPLRHSLCSGSCFWFGSLTIRWFALARFVLRARLPRFVRLVYAGLYRLHIRLYPPFLFTRVPDIPRCHAFAFPRYASLERTTARSQLFHAVLPLRSFCRFVVGLLRFGRSRTGLAQHRFARVLAAGLVTAVALIYLPRTPLRCPTCNMTPNLPWFHTLVWFTAVFTVHRLPFLHAGLPLGSAVSRRFRGLRRRPTSTVCVFLVLTCPLLR